MNPPLTPDQLDEALDQLTGEYTFGATETGAGPRYIMSVTFPPGSTYAQARSHADLAAKTLQRAILHQRIDHRIQAAL